MFDGPRRQGLTPMLYLDGQRCGFAAQSAYSVSFTPQSDFLG
jgi:hypothetical protein